MKDKVAGQLSVYWNTIEECFSDTCAFSAGYEWNNSYPRADFSAPGAPAINEVKYTNKDHASNVVDHFFRVGTQRPKVTPKHVPELQEN